MTILPSNYDQLHLPKFVIDPEFKEKSFKDETPGKYMDIIFDLREQYTPKYHWFIG